MEYESNHAEQCASCEGTGVAQLPLDYPCLEVELFCLDCEKGRQLIARLIEITLPIPSRGRVKAA